MNSFQEVIRKGTEVINLAAGFVDQAAAGLVNTAETLSVDEMSRRLDRALRALRGEDMMMTIAQMKEVLRKEDCLYDNTERWEQLGATSVPNIPDTVIREAYKKGGRVILRCSSISQKADALTEANHSVGFFGEATQLKYQKSVSTPEWIVVPSHIDQSTRGREKSSIVTSEMPAPTPEDWFSVLAYARLDGEREPKGCKGYAFTTKTGTVVGSYNDRIDVNCFFGGDPSGYDSIGAARFGWAHLG